MTDTTSSTTPAGTPPPKKRSIGKLILRLFAVVVVLVIVGLISLYVFRNSLVRAGVIRGGQYATDQKTTLELADLSIAGGKLQLSNFGLSNLQGFSEGNILAMKSSSVSVEPGSLLTSEVVVPEIVLDGLEFTLEQKGMKNNLNELLTILKSKSPAAGDSQKTSPGKKLKIGVVKLTGTKLHIRSDFMKADLDLPALEIKDPTNPDGRPMKIADLIGTILIAMSKQIIENPAVPGNIKDAMKNAEAIVDNVKGQLDKSMKEFGKIAELKDMPKLATQPGEALKGVQDAGKGLQDAGKNLENLNPFGKKK